MTGDVAVEFIVTGAGWADIALRIKDKSFSLTGISYVTDALGDLVRFALAIATGAHSATATFDREPYVWQLQAVNLLDNFTGDGMASLAVTEAESERADERAHEVFRADCGALNFAAAVLDASKRAEPSYAGFGLAHLTFPLAAVHALEAALATYNVAPLDRG